MSETQWNQIYKINKVLYDDYKTRRELLLKRLDVTIQSFKWADRLKVKHLSVQAGNVSYLLHLG